MVLQNSGTLIRASDINIELGRAANATFQLGGSTERGLAGVANGQVRFGDFYGKSNIPASTLNIMIAAYENVNNINNLTSSLRTVASSLNIPVNVSGVFLSAVPIPYNSSYDAVLFWNNSSGPLNYASTLNTYVSNNKGVILGVFANTSYNSPYNNGFSNSYQLVPAGPYTTSNTNYSQIGYSDGGTGILTNVSTVRVSYYNQSFTSVIRGSSVGVSASGGIAVYYEPSASLGRRVDINTWYGDGNLTGDTSTTGSTRLLLNALRWAARQI
jgi:hypothetical protein